MQGTRTSHRPLSVTLRRVGLRGKWMLSAVVALATAAFACSTPTIPQDGTHAAAPKTTLRDPSQRGQLSAPCVAEGVETCFDARDDNCNGLYDEGCGLPDGPLQILVAWDNAQADVDLEVFDPKGEPATVGRATTLGLTKDRDCPKEPNECGGQNVEVVYLEAEQVPLGRYLVTLRLEHADRLASSVTVRLGGHIGNDLLNGTYTLTPLQTEAHFELVRE